MNHTTTRVPIADYPSAPNTLPPCIHCDEADHFDLYHATPTPGILYVCSGCNRTNRVIFVGPGGRDLLVRSPYDRDGELKFDSETVSEGPETDAQPDDDPDDEEPAPDLRTSQATFSAW